ncbi:transposase [Streptomyces sp. NPDC053755]|uniref:transposase n=1 Tax=Streptomyces sp. NPDC053755 TaxID=3155815 RepID=UPI00341DA826
MGRGDLTDEQWAVPAPLLAERPGSGRPPVRARRQLIGGIRIRARTGVPCRERPGRVRTVEPGLRPVRRCRRNGIWQRIPRRPRRASRAV